MPVANAAQINSECLHHSPSHEHKRRKQSYSKHLERVRAASCFPDSPPEPKQSNVNAPFRQVERDYHIKFCKPPTQKSRILTQILTNSSSESTNTFPACLRKGRGDSVNLKTCFLQTSPLRASGRRLIASSAAPSWCSIVTKSQKPCADLLA